MKQELRAFIKESLERGHSREAIRDILLRAGWPESEIRNGLAAFASLDFPVAVPRPAPNLYAREAFLYLVSFIALYVSAISFGLLVFGLIDHSFPDVLDYRENYPSAGQATAIASVIVAFPLYLFLARHLARQASADAERRQSPVRRWLTYFTLVVAAGTILGDLIALLANVLTGDPTTRFALKAVSVLAISAAIFGFYLWDMRQSETASPAPSTGSVLRPVAAVTIITVAGCLAYALFLMGTPQPAKRPPSGRGTGIRFAKHSLQPGPVLGKQRKAAQRTIGNVRPPLLPEPAGRPGNGDSLRIPDIGRAGWRQLRTLRRVYHRLCRIAAPRCWVFGAGLGARGGAGVFPATSAVALKLWYNANIPLMAEIAKGAI